MRTGDSEFERRSWSLAFMAREGHHLHDVRGRPVAISSDEAANGCEAHRKER